MKIVGSCLVVTVDVRPGVRLAAAWSGRYVTIHTVARGGFGIAVDQWDIWDDWLDRPRIPQTLDALERLVLERLKDDADGYLLDMVEDVSAWEDENDRGELIPASLN